MLNENFDDLEEFTNPIGNRKLNKENIYIGKNLTFSLSSSLRKHIENDTHVILYYSRNNNAIIFKFINNENEKGALKISKSSISTSIIYGKHFFNYYRIDCKKYIGRHFVSMEEIKNIGKCYVIFLDKKNEDI